MAVKLTAITQGLSSAIGTSKYYWTMAGWYRHPGTFSADPRLFMMISRALYHTNADGIYINSITPTNTFKPASGDWSYIAWVQNNTSMTLYCWTDTSGSTPTTVTSASALAGLSGTARIGRGDGYSYLQTNAEFLHLRIWEGSNSATGVRSAAELDAERKSATPIVTTGLVQWNDLVADLNADGGYGNAMTAYNGSYEFTANAPTQLSAGASVVHPALLTTRQHIAFAQTF